MSLLEQDTTRKKQVEIAIELDESNSKEYKVEAICNSAMYASKLEGHLLNLYYLILWKGYLEEKNTLELILAIQHLRKLVTIFYCDHLDKPIAISLSIDSAPLIARPTIKPRAEVSSTKQKHS